MYYISNTICENGHFSCNLKIKSGHPTNAVNRIHVMMSRSPIFLDKKIIKFSGNIF